MRIQVLGSGCPTCKKLNEITKQAVKEMNLDEKVEYLSGQEGIQKIMDLGVMSSPVLTVNDKPVMTGFINDVEEIKKLIRQASEK